MALLVQKFGGTSVGSIERIQAIARRIAIKHKEGHSLVIVVSAMGDTTDELMHMAHRISATPPKREVDMLLATGEQVAIALLSIALNSIGIAAVSLTGFQVGILTECAHGRARILKINTERIFKYLKAGQVIIVAGFQGTSSNDGTPEITTLGRGGSDTSAVALAAALGADACEIYTDVLGILTTDPRKVKNAQLINKISCDEMLELASLGAAVLHPRAVEIARNYGVILSVRSSWSLLPGTLLIGGSSKPMSKEGLELAKAVDQAELIQDQALVIIARLPDIPGITATLFEELSKAKLNVDLIVQTSFKNGTQDISFTLKNKQLKRALKICQKILRILDTTEVTIRTKAEMAKLSISGVGIMNRHGIAALLFENLAKAGINLRIIATSEVKISCLIHSKEGGKALNIALKTFGLNYSQYKSKPKNLNLPEVRGVVLDRNQIQISVRNVPDYPEVPALICRILADEVISIDAISQLEHLKNYNSNCSRDISFTLHRSDCSRAKDILNKLLIKWPEAKLDIGPAIARVSAVGAGMPNIPGIAARMFRSLATAGIHIQMITTSEIRISCMVHEVDGVDALQSIHSCFGLGKIN
uniref:aspartate kinase n=1 Tax=Paulinella chromatophora TaxID=39717 RepID=B1X4L4_PAUCH|nr:aspartate kinase [Paulinella chromatophora]ACB42883.1 aspartate kinase [Paulinella chromatophora]